MPNIVELKPPESNLLYDFDWTDQLASGVTLQTVMHIAPSPLLVLDEIVDVESGHSLVEIGGGEHGGLYIVTAQATLSSGELVKGSFTLRVLADPASSNPPPMAPAAPATPSP